jgi:hypothetical protein
MERWDKLWRAALILLISLAMSIMERISENLGLFIHSDFWSHAYTFVGNGVYFTIIYVFHLWFRRNKE